MYYKQYGNTDMMVSAIGLGTMRYNNEDIKAGRLMKCAEIPLYALEKGINYWDTAPFYCDDKSEIVTGIALSQVKRSDVYVTSKVNFNTLGTTTPTRDDFRRRLETSLERLQTDYIDFYLLHAVNNDSWDNKVVKFNVLPKIEKLIAEGKIRHFGFSFHDDLDVFKKVIDAYDGFEFCQIQFNYIDTDYQAGIEGLEYAASKGLGVIVMEPLLGGKLAAPHEKITSVLGNSRTPVEWALDFVWNRPEVGMLLSGMGTEKMVTENIGYADKSAPDMLTAEELDILRKAKSAFDELTAVNCTGCEYCMPCPFGVEIPKVFAAYNNITTGGRRLVKEIMPDIEYVAGRCEKCGACVKACPQHINIPETLRKVVNQF